MKSTYAPPPASLTGLSQWQVVANDMCKGAISSIMEAMEKAANMKTKVRAGTGCCTPEYDVLLPREPWASLQWVTSCALGETTRS